MISKRKGSIGILMGLLLVFQYTSCVTAAGVQLKNIEITENTSNSISKEIEENNLEDNPEDNIGDNTDTPVVTDIDTGEYSKVMVVGETQLLTITLLPITVSDEIQYKSSDENVVTVNGLGRVTGLAVGSASITVSCQGVSKELSIVVEEVKEEESTEIPVTDIELGNYEAKVEVRGTTSLSATAIPSDATDPTVTYTSSNTEIATVTSQGEVKGISQGKAIITIKAGDITKTVEIQVKVAGKIIELNTTYIVLKVGQASQLKAQSIPKESSQDLIYKSSDSSIASVTKGGLITGQKIGSTSIIVSNEDVTNAVTVIVNGTGENFTSDITPNDSDGMEDKKEIDLKQEALLEQIRNKQEVVIQAKKYSVITTAVLRELHKKGTSLIIEHEHYTMKLDGNTILNYENELKTNVEIEETDIGIEIIINKGEPLPGTVEIDPVTKKQYQSLYLYHKSKGIYEKLEYESNQVIRLDIEGQYILTNQNLQKSNFHIMYLVVIGIVGITLIGIYIYVKKKHWFW